MVFAPKVGVSPIGKHRLNSLTVIFRRVGVLIYKKVYIYYYIIMYARGTVCEIELLIC